MGNKKGGSLVLNVLLKKKICSNGVRLGPHYHKVVTESYNDNIGSLSRNCIGSSLSFTNISQPYQWGKF